MLSTLRVLSWEASLPLTKSDRKLERPYAAVYLETRSIVSIG